MKLGQRQKITTDKRDYYRNVYLLSEHWKSLREEKLNINPVCEICGCNKRIDVHHLRYKNLYDVLVEDLQTLCRKCHKKVHGINNKFNKKKNSWKYQKNRGTVIRAAARSMGMKPWRFKKLLEKSNFKLKDL